MADWKAKACGMAVAALLFQGTPAQAQSWSPLVESRGFGKGAVICDNDGTGPSGNYLCLALRCMKNGPLEFALIAEGGDFGGGGSFPVTVTVDGSTVGAISMEATQVTGQKHASGPYDAAAHGGLIAALRSGKRASVTVLGTTIPLSLRGSGRQIDHAFAVCKAGAPQQPSTGPGGGLTAADVRTQLVGRRLSWGDAGTVLMPNGRFEGVLSGRANNGTYRIEKDGRVCWQTMVRGCFRFYRESGALWVKRDDPRSSAVLGEVAIR